MPGYGETESGKSHYSIQWSADSEGTRRRTARRHSVVALSIAAQTLRHSRRCAAALPRCGRLNGADK